MREVFHHPGHGSHRVQRPAQRRQAEPADPSVRGLQPGYAGVGGGVPDRPRGVLPQRAHAQSRGDPRARPRAGAPRHVVAVPGVAGGRDAPGKAAHVELAQQHRPGLPQAAHRGGVLAGTRGLRDSHRSRRARHVVLVLHRHRNAVERSPVPALPDFLLRGPGLLQRALFHEVDVGVQFGIEGVDPVQVGPGQLDGGDLALPQARSHAVNTGETEFRHVRSSGYRSSPGSGRNTPPTSSPARLMEWSRSRLSM